MINKEKIDIHSSLPTKYGVFTLHSFNGLSDGKEHIALTMGEWVSNDRVLVRVHSECLTGDALFSNRCDCGDQLEKAMKSIALKGKGILLYMRQEGRGIGLYNKINAYSLQDQGADTVEANLKLGLKADQREYHVCKEILDRLEVNKIDLMTNNPLKVEALSEFGVDVKRVEILPEVLESNKHYLATKREKMRHQIP